MASRCCAFCKKNLGNNKFRNNGHLAKCVNYLELKRISIEEDMLYGPVSPSHDYGRYDFEDVLPDLMIANDIFLRKQMLVCSVDIIESFKAGAVKMLDGLYKRATMATYLEIANYVARTPCLSIENATDMIVMMKYINWLNNVEIPLPQSFRTIRDNLRYSMRYMVPDIIRYERPFPVELYGEEYKRMPNVTSVYSNVIQVIGKNTGILCI